MRLASVFKFRPGGLWWCGALLFCMGAAVPQAGAAVRVDVKNDYSEECSLAVHFRTDKTKWRTIGWYVFASGEEAPIMLDDVSDVRNVFIYNDCNRNKNQTGTETRKAWVRAQYAFADDSPRDHAQGYEEVVFERLTQQQYLIESK